MGQQKKNLESKGMGHYFQEVGGSLGFLFCIHVAYSWVGPALGQYMPEKSRSLLHPTVKRSAIRPHLHTALLENNILVAH